MTKGVKLSAYEREAPHSHLIQGLSPVIFIIISLLDGVFLHWTTQLNSIVPFMVRAILLAIFLSLALVLIKLSHDALFKDEEPSEVLITEGILGHVRNPMYLGILLIYIAFICFSISLMSIVVFLIIVILNQRMVIQEEKILQQSC